MLQNLFSILTKEQIASLTQEERHTLTKLDEKLFPDYDKYVDEHMKQKSVVEKCFDRINKERADDLQYQKMTEESFC